MERSHREIEAARVLANNNFFAQAISRAYFAAFYAAEEALLSVGETRSKHTGVISAFGRVVAREGGFSQADARHLRSLFERRNQADYLPVEVPEPEARAAVDDAESFVTAVEEWLARR